MQESQFISSCDPVASCKPFSMQDIATATMHSCIKISTMCRIHFASLAWSSCRSDRYLGNDRISLLSDGTLYRTRCAKYVFLVQKDLFETGIKRHVWEKSGWIAICPTTQASQLWCTATVYDNLDDSPSHASFLHFSCAPWC